MQSVLHHCFELEVWGVDEEQRFTFGTKIAFYSLVQGLLRKSIWCVTGSKVTRKKQKRL